MTNMEQAARLHALIDGTVQGVGFRRFVLEHAQAIGLTGWVRNRFDGWVEVTAEGTHQQLEALLDKLRVGPRGSFVSEVIKEWQPHTGEFQRFEVRRTE